MHFRTVAALFLLVACVHTQDAFSSRYAELGRSPARTAALVKGLRTGERVDLGDGVAFQPPTGAMSQASVAVVLALTKASLAQQGITQPAPGQLRSALMRVLVERAEGKNWGQVGESLNLTLGKARRASALSRPDRPDRPEREAPPLSRDRFL